MVVPTLSGPANGRRGCMSGVPGSVARATPVTKGESGNERQNDHSGPERSYARVYFPVFLDQAEQSWRRLEESWGPLAKETAAHYCLMVSGMIDAITSAE